MKQENKKITAYQKARRGFYSKVVQNEKKERQTVIAAALITLLIASVLLFTCALIETNAGKYTYVYGEYEQKISKDQALADGVQYIDMNALADYCNFEKSPSGAKTVYHINGTEAVFYDSQSTAHINGIEIEMPANASLKNGYCLIPLSTAQDLLHGVDISTCKKTVTVTLKDEPVYMITMNANIEYETDISKYLDYINSKDPYIFTLANKTVTLGEDFPEDKDSLIEIPAEYRKSQVIYLYTVAEKALEAMMQDMFAAGLDDTYVTSAYRSYAYQEMLFTMYVDKEMESGISYDEAVAKVLTYSSEPGKSEHQTGLCVDFTTKSIGGVVDDVFEETEVFDWLVENSWKYGFVLRYPKDKVDITGYSYESWHYRFVGREVASVMYQTDLCYEEYLEIFEHKGE